LHGSLQLVFFACFGPNQHAVLSHFYSADWGDSYAYNKAAITSAIVGLGGTATNYTEINFGALGAGEL
jgi:hypothetical protein